MLGTCSEFVSFELLTDVAYFWLIGYNPDLLTFGWLSNPAVRSMHMP